MSSLSAFSSSKSVLSRVPRFLSNPARFGNGGHSVSFSTAAANSPLNKADPELCNVIKKEKNRQITGLELIASENFTSRSVTECLGSCLTNKYSEGYPGERYYGGNEFIDEIEDLARKRALETFKLNPSDWGVNVQPYSGSPANMEALTSVLKPHDRIMGLDLPSGGHLTHGYRTPKKAISSTALFFESMPYVVDQKSGLIDYDDLERRAKMYHPRLIIAGVSAYPRLIDYPRMRKIADSCGAWLLADMAHISGLVAAGLVDSPFKYCDIVTTTTHKTLRGPRAGMIFFRKGTRKMAGKDVGKYDLEDKVNFAVFPGFQGGPHNHQIAAIATCLHEAQHPKFIEYQKQVLRNIKALANVLESRGCKLVTGGTDTHLILVDLRPRGIDGARVERVLDHALISMNKNSVPGDTKPFVPGGLRIGSPALTTRGMTEKDFEEVGELIARGIDIAVSFDKKVGGKLKDFFKQLETDPPPELLKLREDSKKLATKFPMPGHDQL